jgi:hypothetical protein
VRRLTSAPIKIVFDAVYSSESAVAGYEILTSGGDLVVVDSQLDRIKEKVDDKKVIKIYGSVHPATTREFGKEMYKKLTGLLEKGIIVVSLLDLSKINAFCSRTISFTSQTKWKFFRVVWTEFQMAWTECRRVKLVE